MTSIWHGSLIRLRAVEPDDWRYFFEGDEDTDFGRWTYYIPFPVSQEWAKKWTADLAAAPQPANHEFRWVIENLAGEFVGTINTHGCDARVGVFHYGLAIRRAHWRKGYAREAVTLVLRYFFTELRYQKVNVEVYSFNAPSAHFHRALGFVEEGRLRRTVFTNGQYHDEILLGMTMEEFKAAFK